VVGESAVVVDVIIGTVVVLFDEIATVVVVDATVVVVGAAVVVVVVGATVVVVGDDETMDMLVRSNLARKPSKFERPENEVVWLVPT
jgi:hypothetical protein